MVRLEWSVPGLEVRDIFETDDPEAIERWTFTQAHTVDESLSTYLYDVGEEYDDDEAFFIDGGEFL